MAKRKITESKVKEHLLPVMKLISPEINCSQSIKKICEQATEKLNLSIGCINSVAQNDLSLAVGVKTDQHLSEAVGSMIEQLSMA